MGRPKGSKNKPKPITADDLARNCADCPKPRKENRSQPTFSRLEVSTMVLIAALTFSWFVSDWLASL